MTEDIKKRRKRRLIWIVLAGITLVLAAILVPPMISINRYKAQIAELVSQSLGRPVHLSGVELRLVPWPSFVLSNLVVDEDPAYGAEPVLHADTVTTDVRLLALWGGRLEISRISVDSASLNLVRMPGGRWNLDPLFRNAAARAGVAVGKEAQNRRAPRLPYLEATESRINFKNGPEKLPFSILNADLSFWEESPGDWHIRLRGQPARTDVSLFQEDTGVVRLDASLHSAPALRQIPLHVNLEWREAQLGQLSRLLIGSDPGWRGNLTADLQLDGTPETAHVIARLQAAGVHRAEFAPAEALDFDANCGFIYHYSSRAVQNLDCNSPLGKGRIRVAGDLPGSSVQPHLTVALDHIPVAAGLAFLRTIRSGIDPGLNASGSISGKITYSEVASAIAPPPRPGRNHLRVHVAAKPEPVEPLSGTLTVSGFQLSGGGLDTPIQARHIILAPESSGTAGTLALSGSAEIPAGAPTPLTVTPRLTSHGYDLSIRGQASMADSRQIAHLAGIGHVTGLSGISGGPVVIALNAQGSWLPPEPVDLTPLQPVGPNPPPESESADPPKNPPAASEDNLAGTVTVHNATWKPDYLARGVAVSQATLHLDSGQASWDPVEFSYGPIKATASLTLPSSCPGDRTCPARFELQFGAVNAAELQSAILGARPQTSLLDSLIGRLHLSSAPAWPPLEGTVQAESLELGPVTLVHPVATLKIDSDGARIASLDGDLLGGQIHASGSFSRPETDQGRPAYTLDATLTDLAAPEVGKLLGMHWSGGALKAEGKIDVAGLTARELAASAKGKLHFEWRNGAIASRGSPQNGIRAARFDAPEKNEAIPTQLTRFTSLDGEAEIANGNITLRNCEAVQGTQRHPVDGQLSFGEPPVITFSPSKAAKLPEQTQPEPNQSARK